MNGSGPLKTATSKTTSRQRKAISTVTDVGDTPAPERFPASCLQIWRTVLRRPAIWAKLAGMRKTEAAGSRTKPSAFSTHGWICLAGACMMVFAMACSHETKPPARAPAAVTEKPVAIAPTPISLPRSPSGTPGASLTLVNDFPIAQHVFAAGVLLGSVAAGTSASFPVPLGTREIVCADSPDATNNPTSLVATFESGFEYTYRL